MWHLEFPQMKTEVVVVALLRAPTTRLEIQKLLGRIDLQCIHSEGRGWALDLSSLDLHAFLGRPDFGSRGPQILILKGFGATWCKNLGH